MGIEPRVRECCAPVITRVIQVFPCQLKKRLQRENFRNKVPGTVALSSRRLTSWVSTITSLTPYGHFHANSGISSSTKSIGNHVVLYWIFILLRAPIHTHSTMHVSSHHTSHGPVGRGIACIFIITCILQDSRTVQVAMYIVSNDIDMSARLGIG